MQLLELLEDRTEDADVALEAATSLAHILQIAPTPTLKALDKHDAVTMLAYVVKRQQQFEGAQVQTLCTLHNMHLLMVFQTCKEYVACKQFPCMPCYHLIKAQVLALACVCQYQHQLCHRGRS